MNLSRMVRRGVPALAVAALLAPTALVGLPADARESGNRAYFSPGNGTLFTINDHTNASPYSTGITVENMPGQIQYVTVTLHNLYHTHPSDVDVLLKAPDGRAAIIMSDVGANKAINAVTVTIDDRPGAGPPMPTTSILTTGTYQSTNFAEGGADDDAFGLPAPNPSGTSLSQFTASPPNGTWELFIRDDTNNNYVGQLRGGWTLGIKTTNTGPVARTDRYKIKENTRLVTSAATGVLRNDYDLDAESFWVTGVVQRPRHGTVNLRRDGSFTYTPRKNFDGKDGFSYQIRDSEGLVSYGYARVKVQNDKSLDKKADKGKKKTKNTKGGKGKNRR